MNLSCLPGVADNDHVEFRGGYKFFHRDGRENDPPLSLIKIVSSGQMMSLLMKSLKLDEIWGIAV